MGESNQVEMLNGEQDCNGNANHKGMIVVATANVAATLSPDEMSQAFHQLFEKMKTQDPLNPNLWTVFVGQHKLWGILDERAGPQREDVLTLLFPEDY